MANLIQKTDTLNAGRIKLNEAILDADKAKMDASVAKSTAEQALANSESTQTQLDTIVIDGDSSVEAAQARVSAEGTAYGTLKQRLDSEHASVTSQLEDIESELGDKDDLLTDGDNLVEKLVNEFEDRGYNIRWGALMASEDNGDWTRAIQTIYNSLTVGDTLYIPKGRWSITNIVFDKPGVNLDIRGTLVQSEDASGVAVQIGSESQRTRGIKVFGVINVEREAVDWDIDTIGVKAINLYESDFAISNRRFSEGLVLEATIGNGTAYNNIYIHDMLNNKHGITTRSHVVSQSERGWVNENNFYGGTFSWSSSIMERLPEETIQQAFERLGCIHVNITGRYDNNNIFYSPSLEGHSGKFIYCNGNSNTFYSPRLEGQSIIAHFANESIYNQVIYPYLNGNITDFIDNQLIVDEGSRNHFYGRNEVLLDRTHLEAGSYKAYYRDGDNDKVGSAFEGHAVSSQHDLVFRGMFNNQENFSVNGRGEIKGELYRFNNGNSITPDGKLFGGHWELVDDVQNMRSVKIVAIKTTNGPPTTSQALIGSACLNTTDNKLYFHFGGGVWKGMELS